jgi:Dolichyl-phosphate-mannose-protein mannosyltransferase
MTRISRWLVLTAFLLQAGFFLFVARHRLIDGDEGFYLLAARLVLQHKTPYLDFFYPQAPLLPYVYAAWLKVGGISWFVGRALAALLTTLIGTMLFEQVYHETRSAAASATSVILFASSTLVFCWLPVVKTLSLATFFLFASYVLLARLGDTGGAWLAALSGVLFGLGVDTRSYLIVVVPIFLWWIWRAERSFRVSRLLWFSAGLLVGLAPSFLLFFRSPDVFLFNNLGYHAIRSDEGLVGDWHNKLLMLLALFGGSQRRFQVSGLVVICALMFFRLSQRRPAASFALGIALLLGVVSLLPTPAYIQYFSVVIPFLITGTMCLLPDFLAQLQSPTSQRNVRIAGIVFVALFILAGVPTFRQFLQIWQTKPYLKDVADPQSWTLEQVSAVSAALDQVSVPGEPVASFWPGYIFASHANSYRGYEDSFGMLVAGYLDPAQRRRYHVRAGDDIAADLAGHGPRLVVVGNQGLENGSPPASACISALGVSGYTPIVQVGETYIYACCSNP